MAGLNVDGYFDIRFSQDKIQAFADIYPPQGGGRNVTAEEIVSTLQKRGVAYGYNFEAIENAVKHVRTNAAPCQNVLAAQGQLPVAGTDAQIAWKIDTAKASEPLPTRPDGLPDYFAYDSARLVKAGQELATIIPGLPGSPGKPLVAPFEAVPQTPGRDCPVFPGPGVALSAGRQRFEAKVTGFVQLHNDKLSIQALSLVEGDLNGGNHSFPGGVIVLGAVRGATVHARGPIAVRGLVSFSSLRGSGHMVIEAAEESRLVADGDIHVASIIRDCETVTPKRIVGETGSTLSGGSITASEGIDAFTLGSESFDATDVILGSETYSSIRLREIEDEIQAAEENAKRIGVALKPLMSVTAGPISDQKRALIQTLMDQKRELESWVGQLHSERRTRQMAHYDSAGSIRVAGRAHAGVRVNLYGAQLDVKQCEPACEFRRSADGQSVVVLASTPAAEPVAA